MQEERLRHTASWSEVAGIGAGAGGVEEVGAVDGGAGVRGARDSGASSSWHVRSSTLKLDRRESWFFYGQCLPAGRGLGRINGICD